jgi:hypothetical protein
MDPDTTTLERRIEEEFARSREKLDKLRRESVREHHERQERLQRFETICESLAAVWRPRLDALRRRFGEKVSVTPRTAMGRRQATFSFNSALARVNLEFGATTDGDVRTLILEYALEILPVLMSYPDRARLELPFDKIDPKAVAAWIDDRVIDFVRTYLSLHENEFYLKAHMVEDPVARVRFPRFAAASTLERGGRTLYFIANETRDEFVAAEKSA